MAESPVGIEVSHHRSLQIRFALVFVDHPARCMIRARDMRNRLSVMIVAVLVASLIAARIQAQRGAVDPAIRIADNDVGGIVSGANGPEAGVWVIAETTGLPTQFSEAGVTDDTGRYLIPDLP